jgi:hypothetical protein
MVLTSHQTPRGGLFGWTVSGEETLRRCLDSHVRSLLRNVTAGSYFHPNYQWTGCLQAHHTSDPLFLSRTVARHRNVSHVSVASSAVGVWYHTPSTADAV